MKSYLCVDDKPTELLTDVTVDSCKPWLPDPEMVVGEDSRRSGVTLLL